MPRKRQEHLIRTVAVRSVNTHLALRVPSRRERRVGPEASASIQVLGILDEPVKERTKVRISVREDEQEQVVRGRPAAVADVLVTGDEVTVGVPMSTKLFGQIWQLAASGRLLHAWISMTAPHYGVASVSSIAFSSEPDE